MNQKILFPEIVITKLKWTNFNFLKADFLNNKDTVEISMSLWEIHARSEEWDIIVGNKWLLTTNEAVIFKILKRNMTYQPPNMRGHSKGFCRWKVLK